MYIYKTRCLCSSVYNYSAFGTSHTIFKPASEERRIGVDGFHTTQKYLTYDTNGNLLEYQKRSDINEVILWGYNNQLPVAKISGSNYTTVHNVIRQSQIDSLTNSIYPILPDTISVNRRLMNLLNKLRTDSRTKNAFTYSYSYSGLNGLRSQTDPKGNSIYYKYDGFGQLGNVRDKDQYLIKLNEYHYKQ